MKSVRSLVKPLSAVESAGLPATRADAIYQALKDELFDFVLLPGDRFTETEIASRLNASRTPVREALFRLQREGLVKVNFRSGWEVVPLDFQVFDDLYDVRQVFETTAVQRLCLGSEPAINRASLAQLEAIWLAPKAERSSDGKQVAQWDEAFHIQLVVSAGNEAMSKMHREISERIRIIRRLDFSYDQRIDATYEQHAAILRAIRRRRAEQAVMLIRSHIAESQAEVRKISLHRLHEMRTGKLR